MREAIGVGNAMAGAPGGPSAAGCSLPAPAALLLAALESFRQKRPGRYGVRHVERCANSPGVMHAEINGPVPCSARCQEVRRVIELAGGAA